MIVRTPSAMIRTAPSDRERPNTPDARETSRSLDRPQCRCGRWRWVVERSTRYSMTIDQSCRNEAAGRLAEGLSETRLRGLEARLSSRATAAIRAADLGQRSPHKQKDSSGPPAVAGRPAEPSCDPPRAHDSHGQPERSLGVTTRPSARRGEAFSVAQACRPPNRTEAPARSSPRFEPDRSEGPEHPPHDQR